MASSTTRTIKKTGMHMGDVANLLTSIVALVNELRTDHATVKTLLDELIVDHAAFITLTSELKSDFDAHTHNADGAQAGSYFTSIPKTDAATVSAGTTRSIAAAVIPTLTAAAPATITAEEVSMSDH